MKILVKILALILSIASVVSLKKSVVATTNANNYSYVTMNVEDNVILLENDALKKHYPASLTKILTAICVIENCNVDEMVLITEDTVNVEGSSIYLKEGQKYSVKSLLYGLMLRSGNDSAETLAKHVSGSVDDFVALMNRTAKNLGAINSNFVNPHGLHDDNHYTTAFDLALITSYAMKNPLFSEIVSTKKVTVGYMNELGEEKSVTFVNKNKMLNEYEGAVGVKTGFTKKAGRCLVSGAKRDGKTVISVVFNVYDYWNESKKLLDKSFEKIK